MTDTKQPEALRLAEILEGDYCPDWFYEQGVDEVAAELRRQHARIAELEQEVAHTDSLLGKANALARIRAHRIAELEADHFPGVTKMTARWYMVDKDGMATLCTDREDAEQEAKDADMAWLHTAPHRAVQLVEASFDSADMATATAQGFRDGVASVAAGAVSEPVAWRAQFDAWWARNRVSTHQVKNIGGFAAKVWHAAIQTVVGATDSTAGFYPADEGSNPSRQATNSSPPEGIVGGWMPIETAPKESGYLLLRGGREQDVASGYWLQAAYAGNGAWIWPFVHMTPRFWAPLPPSTSSADEGGSNG